MYGFSTSEARRSGTVKANLPQKRPFEEHRGPAGCGALHRFTCPGLSGLGGAQGQEVTRVCRKPA